MKSIIGLLLACCLLCSCESNAKQRARDISDWHGRNIPPGATDVEPLNAFWVEFTYKNHRYLFFNPKEHKSALTRID
ncbi:MAG: hypothetical protein DWQ19_09205 [Crenarchaeota archaeon]|nr:MAG: hypothetical protein DWQ19_09205 [Thermoproteota archaeon]